MFKLLDVDYIAESVIESVASEIAPAISEDLNNAIDEIAELSTFKGFLKALFTKK